MNHLLCLSTDGMKTRKKYSPSYISFTAPYTHTDTQRYKTNKARRRMCSVLLVVLCSWGCQFNIRFPCPARSLNVHSHSPAISHTYCINVRWCRALLSFALYPFCYGKLCELSIRIVLSVHLPCGYRRTYRMGVMIRIKAVATSSYLLVRRVWHRRLAVTVWRPRRPARNTIRILIYEAIGMDTRALVIYGRRLFGRRYSHPPRYHNFLVATQ